MCADLSDLCVKPQLVRMIARRRKDIKSAIAERRGEIQRRINSRKCFLQRLKRMAPAAVSPYTVPWNFPENSDSDWWEEVVLKKFQPKDWLEKFRMSRDTFFSLCGKLEPRLARTNMSVLQGLPLEKRVAVALWRLGTNVEYRTVGMLFGLGYSGVCQCVRDVCHAIVLLLKPLYLQLPGEREMDASAMVFNANWGFPHCVGAVDCLHVPIVAPPDRGADWWNRSGWQSVVMQGVVNAQGMFWDVCAGFSGSTEDVTILLNSSLWSTATEGGLSPQPPRNFMGRPLKYVLLGDAAYPLQSWLLKCYPESPLLASCHRAFNYHLSRARSVIHDTFQHLKARWQCLHRGSDCPMDLLPTMILACCVLHNACETHEDVFLHEWLEEVSEADGPQPNDTLPAYMDDPGAEEVRSLFCDYFQQVGRHPPQAEPPCSGATSPNSAETAAAVEMLALL
ncbi:putative nuclease HARBI1 [Arapaima gigas]